jgi:hypothetical protein
MSLEDAVLEKGYVFEEAVLEKEHDVKQEICSTVLFKVPKPFVPGTFKTLFQERERARANQKEIREDFICLYIYSRFKNGQNLSKVIVGKTINLLLCTQLRLVLNYLAPRAAAQQIQKVRV